MPLGGTVPCEHFCGFESFANFRLRIRVEKSARKRLALSPFGGYARISGKCCFMPGGRALRRAAGITAVTVSSGIRSSCCRGGESSANPMRKPRRKDSTRCQHSSLQPVAKRQNCGGCPNPQSTRFRVRFPPDRLRVPCPHLGNAKITSSVGFHSSDATPIFSRAGPRGTRGI